MLLLIIRLLLFFFIPTFLIYVGKDSSFFTWIKTTIQSFNDIDVVKTQFYSFFIGTFWVGVYNPIHFEILRRKFYIKNSKYTDLLENNKNTYLQILKQDAGIPMANIKLRLFFPKRSITAFIKRILYGEVTLVMKHKQGITDKFHANNISFKAFKDHQEGMVGKSYSSKKGMCDFNLATQNEYFLTDKQKIQVGNTKFCSTVPIFGKDSQKVKAILSIDSDEQIEIQPDDLRTVSNKITAQMLYISAFTDKYIN